MAEVWDLTSVKGLLRTTSQRLGQLQDRNDAKGIATRREIAALLQQGNVGPARMKALVVMREDAFGDLLEMLEMHVGIILEHISEIAQSSGHNQAVLEAASSIIYSAPQVECKELQDVRDLLVRQMGIEFSKAAAENRDKHVSTRIIRALSTEPATAIQVDEFLVKVAKSFNIEWFPDPQGQDIQKPLSDILDPNTIPVVDIAALRRLCSRGIPEELSWLRPKVWKLYFGILPLMKTSWHREMNQQRSSYYELVRRLLEPYSSLSTPTSPLHPLDTSLIQAAQQLSSIPSNLFYGLETVSKSSSLCPVDDAAPSEVKLLCAKNLDIRLKAIQDEKSPATVIRNIPEIRFENETTQTSVPDASSILEGVHEKHFSALLRILYLHTSINPANRSPNVPILLAPVYSVLNQEIDGEDSAHVEADTFWLFEALIAEFSELEDEDGGRIWMKKFSDRLAWADHDLWDNMAARGLDPVQPHYSYGWLGPLLAATIPYTSLVMVWDTIFSCQSREKEDNARLDMLLDVCTSMLVRSKGAILRLGKSQQKAQTLWGQDIEVLPPPSPIRPWEVGNAFSEAMKFLQNYQVDGAGGIDRILQLAVDFKQRREEETRAAKEAALPLGARLRVTMWKGFTNQLSSPERSPTASDEEEEDEGEEGESTDDGRPVHVHKQESLAPGLTSKLANTVWRGITNQSSMEAPPTPITPATPAIPRTPPSHSIGLPANATSPPSSPTPAASSLLWGVAEKFKDSDAAAAFAKASSNWRAKALMGSWGKRNDESPPVQNPIPMPIHSQPASPMAGFNPGEIRRGSLPDIDHHDDYSPPPRPQHFRPPRDTVIFPKGVNYAPSSPELSPKSDSGIMEKTKSLQASLAALTRSQSEAPEPPAKPKAGPRPLLLSSSSLMTSGRERPLSRSENSTPIPRQATTEWTRVMATRQASHRDSQSSISSLSPSDALARNGRSGWDSDGSATSRKVPLNRQSVSPMAPHFRTASIARSIGTLSDRGQQSPSSQAAPSPVGWSQFDLPDSPPIPHTPIGSPTTRNNVVTINDPEESSDSIVPSMIVNTPQDKKLARLQIPSSLQSETTSESSTPETPSKNTRVRSKRYQSRPTNLRLQDPGRRSPSTLTVESPQEQEAITTPRAAQSQFDEVVSSPSPTSPKSRSRKTSADDSQPLRKLSTEGDQPRPRKISTGSRTRKISSSRKARDSAAEEGDDEGYDDLLSAYESEEGATSVLR
ncbi:hypothetical protein V5O48_008676 [Marasmius crinis-equi]|uniref:Rab-GAP TBC domain-containing protein n=1 Tax=Marasmius crinis-equi TaxID=585013 RepID=A0ABR3FDB8_9AGAR